MGRGNSHSDGMRNYARNKDAQDRRRKATADENRRRINEYKAARGCFDCGWGPAAHDFVVEALHLDHLPGHHKVASVSLMVCWSWDRIVVEMSKCDVVCARCHAIRTYKRRQHRTLARKVFETIAQPSHAQLAFEND